MIMCTPKDADLILVKDDQVDMYWIAVDDMVWSVSTEPDDYPTLFVLSQKEALISVETNMAEGWTVDIQKWRWMRLVEEVSDVRSFDEWSKRIAGE